MMLHWSDGPQARGCLYHKRGIRKRDAESIVVDIFVMPSIVKRRPVAVTVGRYRDYKPVIKEQSQLEHPGDMPSIAALGVLLQNVGVPVEDVPRVIEQIKHVLTTEAAIIQQALRLARDQDAKGRHLNAPDVNSS